MSTLRRLIVLRHAKSSWASGATTDHQRPLNARGQSDAPRVATALGEIGWLPQLILSSDSQRTRETYQRMAPEFPTEIPVQFHASLYHAGLSEILAEAPAVPDDVSTLLVLGHNPGWQEAVRQLSGEEVAMKTANAALLEGDGRDWIEALQKKGGWRLLEMICARDLS
ncbi:MAG: histidine phosphatase family protein [Planctomycetaceae bacterium]|nr:histidine phosphatase family protein [Planctomycetaceae bacterium]